VVIIEFEALTVDLDACAAKVPGPKRSVGSFEPAERVKEVPLDPCSSNGRTVHVSTALSPK
jgi:hypothetical protein